MVLKDHTYVTNHTYTGPGCAMCGKSEDEHPKKKENHAPVSPPASNGKKE